MKKVLAVLLLVPAIVWGAETKGFLGVYLQDLDEGMKTAIGVDYGVLVVEVIEDSPAEEAGIEEGDVILLFDGVMVENQDQLAEFLIFMADKEVGITVLRQGEQIDLKVRIGTQKVTKIEKIEKEEQWEREEWIPKGSWGGGGGPSTMYFSPKLKEINDQLGKSTVLGETFDKGMFLTGGWGCGTIWRNLRIGGGGGGGSMTITGNKRKAKLSISYGGFLAEYFLPLGKLHLFVGTMLGGGTVGLKISRSTKVGWDEMWDYFDPDSTVLGEYYEADLDAGFFYYQPYVGFNYALAPWLYLTLGGGWFGTHMGAWEEMEIELGDYPKMDFSNYCITLGVMFGYFTR